MNVIFNLCELLTPYTLNYLPPRVISDIESSKDPSNYIRTLCLNTVVRFTVLCTGKSFQDDIDNQRLEPHIARIILKHDRNQYFVRMLNYRKIGREDGHVDLICKINKKYYIFESSLGGYEQTYKELTSEEVDDLFKDEFIIATIAGDIPIIGENVDKIIDNAKNIIVQNQDSNRLYCRLMNKI